MLPVDFIPVKPFPDFKWKWASPQCTESLNDPVVLLGVLFRLHKLEKSGLKYSSDEFANEMRELSNDIKDSVAIDLPHRVGERNLIRNSGQYWRALGLLEAGDRSGKIRLTDFGRRVADRDVSQAEFAAITVQTFRLPNPAVQSPAECQEWHEHKLALRPLALLLTVLRELNARGQGHITKEELVRIVVPLSGIKAEIVDYVNFIVWFRENKTALAGWPDCTPAANDHRIAREYLLFLSHYGYTEIKRDEGTGDEMFVYNETIDAEIGALLAEPTRAPAAEGAVADAALLDIATEIERKRVGNQRTSRSNQAKFRKDVLKAFGRCVITNVTMPEVLEAAHIKPFKYNGEDTVANGLAMRMDIHLLFDAGHLRISDAGEVYLSARARMDYGALVPPKIGLPDCTNRDHLRWRWDNYNGI